MSEIVNYTVELKTNDTQKVFIFANWEYTSNESVSFDIIVNSCGFAAKQKFYIDIKAFETFLRKIEKMSVTLTGSIELKEEWEHPYIKMELDKLGHLSVMGEFFWFGPLDQHLKFGFQTDQTCLQPLFNDLSRVVNDLRNKT